MTDVRLTVTAEVQVPEDVAEQLLSGEVSYEQHVRLDEHRTYRVTTPLTWTRDDGAVPPEYDSETWDART